MLRIIGLVGSLIGVVGVLVCVFAAGARVMGHYHVLAVQTESLFSLGTALMVAACLAKLETIAATTRDRNA